MIEDDRTEFKSSWADNYLRNVAALANTGGGRLYVGVDDHGDVVGVDDIVRLLKLIPDKIQTTLGIVPTVRHLTSDGLDYIEIDINPGVHPVFHDGGIWVKTGSTTRRLENGELSSFLSQNPQMAWSSYPADGFTFDDIDTYAFREFKKLARDLGQLTDSEMELPTEAILDKLELTAGGKPSRAAAMLFTNSPERISGGAMIRIARMKDADVLFYDEIRAPLYLQVDMAVNLIKMKYTTSPVGYRGLSMVEYTPYPFAAVREAILNAIINNDYGQMVPVKIMVYDDHMEILNIGGIPYGTNLESIMRDHVSRPRNRGIAFVFRLVKYIEHFGRGLEKINRSYDGTDVTPPSYDANNVMFFVRFENIVKAKGIVSSDFYGNPLEPEVEIQDDGGRAAVISAISNDSGITLKGLEEATGLSYKKVRQIREELVAQEIIVNYGSDRKPIWKVVNRI